MKQRNKSLSIWCCTSSCQSCMLERVCNLQAVHNFFKQSSPLPSLTTTTVSTAGTSATAEPLTVIKVCYSARGQKRKREGGERPAGAMLHMFCMACFRTVAQATALLLRKQHVNWVPVGGPRQGWGCLCYGLRCYHGLCVPCPASHDVIEVLQESMDKSNIIRVSTPL